VFLYPFILSKHLFSRPTLTNVSFKAKLDRVYQDGLKNLNLTFVLRDVAWPVIVPLSLFITVPYATFIGLLPALGEEL